MAGTFGLEFARKLPLRLSAFDDRIHLIRRTADHSLGRRGVDTHFQVWEVGKDSGDLVGGVLDQSHQSDVLTEQHRLALAHQVRTRADGTGRIG